MLKKKTLFGIILLLVLSPLLSCSKTSQNESCNFLLDSNFSEIIELQLPQYSSLNFTGNSIYIPNVGNNGGIFLANTGNNFLAWDASDPNLPLTNNCSLLKNSGLFASSSCEDGNKYNLLNGLPVDSGDLPCSLKNYRVQRTGNTLIISN